MKRLLILLIGVSCWAATNSITITDTTGSAQTDRPFSIGRVFKQGEISAYARPVIDGTPATTWQCDRKSQWSDNSLKFAIVSFKASLAANGSITVTFQNSTNPCSSGDQAACNAAALDEAGMLNFNSGNWGASIETTASSITHSASARTIVDAADFTYWLRGPVVTQVVAEDASTSRSYDFGYTCTANCTDDYSTATWSDDTTDRSLHPMFVLTFYAGWSGVKVDYILANYWTTHLQDQRYDVTLKSDSTLSTTKYSLSGVTQYAGSVWRKTFWDGSEPGSVHVDHNFEYLISTGVVPNYNTSLTPSSTTIANEYANYTGSKGDTPLACPASNTRCGGIYKSMPDTGDRSDIGLFPKWTVLWLYSMDDDMLEYMLGAADTEGLIPRHWRESATGKYFDDLDTVDAYGEPLSIDARPTVWARTWDFSGTASADRITPVATLSNSDGWSIDEAHQPSLLYIPYLITGDWYYLHLFELCAADQLANSNPDPNLSTSGRHNDWGYFPAVKQPRGQAWDQRDLGHVIFCAVDGTAEKTYFEQKFDYNMEVEEGRYNITDGNFYHPESGSKWYWGRNTVDSGLSNPLHFLARGETGNRQGLDTSVVATGDSPWMFNFKLTVWEYLKGLGLPTDGIIGTMSAFLIDQIEDPNYNPYLCSEYRIPVKAVATNTYFTNWTDVKNGYLDPSRTTMKNADQCGSYSQIARGTMALLKGYNHGSYSGTDAWNWIDGQLSAYDCEYDPRWRFVPTSGSSQQQHRSHEFYGRAGLAGGAAIK